MRGDRLIYGRASLSMDWLGNIFKENEMGMTDAQVEELVSKLRIAFGVATMDDLVSEMANRFLRWKLPKHFSPDSGISFKPTNKNGYDEVGCWPIGTNLFDHEQAKDMVRYMIGVPPNAVLRGEPLAASPLENIVRDNL